MSRTIVVSFFAAFAVSIVAGPAGAFSQQAGRRGEGTPIGHEFLTIQSGIEILDTYPAARRPAKAANPNVPQAALEKFRRLRAEGDDWFKPKYGPIKDAVYGQRWVDLAGMDLVQAKKAGISGSGPDCFNGIAQNPDELQHDHYLRGRQEAGWEGGLRAIHDSNARFKKYFVKAATAPPGVLRFRDGGVQVNWLLAQRNNFLFGRAVHLFQDSFSPEHAVRSPIDGYRKVRGIKSYVCTALSDSHTTHLPVTILAGLDRLPVFQYADEDIIWKDLSKAGKGGAGFADANIKVAGLVALEASKDLWAAWFRVMALPQEQRAAAGAREADQLVATWLTPDEPSLRARYPSNRTMRYEGRPPAGVKVLAFVDQLACDDLKATERRMRKDVIAAERDQCLRNITKAQGSTGEMDEVLRIPYDWGFKKTTWDAPVKRPAQR